MADLDVKLEKLKAFIADVGKDGVAVAFSGGVDSSTLAAVTKQVLGEKAIAVIAQSPTYTSEELVDAEKICPRHRHQTLRCRNQRTWATPTSPKTPRTAATSAKKSYFKPSSNSPMNTA